MHLANQLIQAAIRDNKFEDVAELIYKSDAFSKSIHNLTHRGADVNAANENGYTPLHIAAKENHTNCLQALVNAGANVNARTKNGETPLHIAAKHGNKECLNSLLSNRTEVTKTLEAVYENLKAAHMKIDKAMTSGQSIISDAEIILQLLETTLPALSALADVGANIDARTIDGKTPVDIARECRENARECRENECIRILTKNGEDPRTSC